MRKKIGIPGWLLASGAGFGVSMPYISYLSQFGRPVILTPEDDVRDDIDLLFLPGGGDLLTTRYEQIPQFTTGAANQILEHFDQFMLPEYLKLGVPIIGVCRGLQTLNVALGGSLTQHLRYHVQSEFPEQGVHELSFADKYKNLANKVAKVNSRHHQCIDEIADELEIVAWAKEGKHVLSHIPEVVVGKTRPIFAVQYHPEDCYETLTEYFIMQYLKKSSHVGVN